MSLLALQRAFCADLRGRPAAISAHVEGDPEIGLGVYRNAYRLRLAECLRETYGKTWGWLGDDDFNAAARRYIEAHPPKSWTLSDYGDRFPDLLALLYPNDPEVSELAWLEWAMHRAFEGPDAAPLSAEDCAGVDWDRAVFSFAPTLQLRPITTNCGALWAAMAAKESPPSAERLPSPAALCVWRKDLAPSFRTLEGRELLALKTALAGAPFGAICLLVSGDSDEETTIAQLGAILARWLQDEMLADITINA